MSAKVLTAWERIPTRGPHCCVDLGEDEQPDVLPAEVSHHLLDVLRARVGDPVSVTDGRGRVWQCTITQVDRRRCTVSAEEQLRQQRPTPRLMVAVGLPKGRKMDEIVRRLTEMGVSGIYPVLTERGENRPPAAKIDKVRDRWLAIAIAAVEQSRRAFVPVVAGPAPLSDLVSGAHVGVVMWEESPTRLADALPQGHHEEVMLLIGSEGGLSAEEVATSGLQPTGLGGGILRTETAAVAGAALMLHHLGRLG